MKLVDKLIRILLVLMIIISIILSFQTWLDLGFYPLNKKEQLNQKITKKSEIKERKKQVIYFPAKLYIHEEDQVKLDARDSILRNIFKNLTGKHYSVAEQTKKYDLKDLVAEQNISTGFELVYNSPLSLAQFLSTYNLLVDGNKPNNFQFDRVIVNAANGQLVFLNTKDLKACILAGNHQFEKLYNQVKEASNNGVTLQKNNNQTFDYDLKDKIELPIYQYAISIPSYTLYTNTFFNRVGELTAKDNMDNLIFSDDEDNTLQLNSSDGIVTFNQKIYQDTMDLKLQNEITQNIEKLGTEVGDLRFFMTTPQMEMFRLYVEGYPVFGNNHIGEVVAVIEQSKHLKIALNQEILQVPLPTDEKKEVLSTEEVNKKLTDKKIDLNKIEQRQIGYTWVQKDKEKVALEPEWYLLIDNKWQSLDSVINQSEGE